MPLYDYRCERCGGFRMFRPMSESGAAAPCPRCAASSERVLTTPFLAGGDAPAAPSSGSQARGGFRHACGFGCAHDH